MHSHHSGHVEELEGLGKVYDHKIASRLFGYMAPLKGRIFIALGLMLVASATNLVGPYLVKIAIDTSIANLDVASLDFLAVIYIFNGLVGFLALWGQTYSMAYVGQHVIYRLRGDLFQHLQALSLRFYGRQQVGRLISLVQNDVGALSEVASWGITGITGDILTLIGIVIVMFSMNGKLSLLTFMVLPLLIWVASIWRLRARETYHAVRQALAAVNANLQESIAGVRVVQAFSREEKNLQEFDQLNSRHWQATLTAASQSSILSPAVDLLGAAAVGLIIWYGGNLALEGELTAGVLVAFILYVSRFFEPIRDLSQRYTTLQAATVAGERIFELMDTPERLKEADDAVTMPPIKGHIILQKVTFGYEKGRPVLKEIDLEIRPGEKVALVGVTGAGKTSLASLIPRFYDPWQGTVSVDSYDLQQVKLSSLRSQMGIVPQEPFLFSGTVKDNIHYGRLDADDDEILEAAKAADAHDFIMRLPQGYETDVQEGGSKLSTGQRQLIAIARAILADPKIIILDEATSSVDTETERVVQQALGHLLQGRTAVIIAHRLSTVRDAERIVVMEDGHIVDAGTHDELLARDGVYRRLYLRQYGLQEAA